MAVSSTIEERIAGAPLSVHLATSLEDRPHVAPVWYVYEDGSLWIVTGGKKLANLKRNRRVACSIEAADEEGVDWAVQLLGTARIVEDEARVREVEAAMEEIYRDQDAGTDGDRTEDDERPDRTDDAPGTDGTATDGGMNEAPVEWALVEIRIGSATLQDY